MAGRTIEHAVLDHIVHHRRQGFEPPYQITIDVLHTDDEIRISCRRWRLCKMVEYLPLHNKVTRRASLQAAPKRGRAPIGVN
jgi:hypothetical protein